MEAKICLVIPYFGQLPNYFSLFLKSCSFNQDIDWLLITDDKTPYDYPPNFQVIYMAYEDNYSLIQAKFDFPVTLHRAYKLCDFKPAYGYIYSEFLKGYSHWGHCDTDVIMGNLRAFLTDELLNSYDKLFCLGHMTIYKNTDENNRIFMNSLNGESIYKEVYTSGESCCFGEDWKDEKNVNTLFQHAGKTIYSTDYSLNIDFWRTKFIRVVYVGREVPNNGHGYVLEDYKPCIYLWEKGHIYRYFKEEGKIVREEFMYMHLQQRKMKVLVDAHEDVIKVVPNAFLPLETEGISVANFDKIKTKIRNDHYWRIHILPKIRKIKKILSFTH